MAISALRPPPSTVPWLLVVSSLGAVAAGALVVVRRPIPAGIVGLVAGLASIVAGAAARRSREPRFVFADHAVERLLEASLFGTIAWVTAASSPWTAGAALAALVSSYLASYLTAKATGLGFEVRERLPYRSVRPLFPVVGLLVPPALDLALWAAVAISLEPFARHGLSIARQEEPA